MSLAHQGTCPTEMILSSLLAGLETRPTELILSSL
jgi:hypothetical protein